MNNTDVGSVCRGWKISQNAFMCRWDRVQQQVIVAGQEKETATFAAMHHFTFYLPQYLSLLLTQKNNVIIRKM